MTSCPAEKTGFPEPTRRRPRPVLPAGEARRRPRRALDRLENGHRQAGRRGEREAGQTTAEGEKAATENTSVCVHGDHVGIREQPAADVEIPSVKSLDEVELGQHGDAATHIELSIGSQVDANAFVHIRG